MDLSHSSGSVFNTTIPSPRSETDRDDDQAILQVLPVVTQGLDGGWLAQIATTVILLFGSFGNVMTVIILRRLRSGWSAMNVYLTALALSDTAMLYSGAPPIWARRVLAYDIYASHVFVCKIGNWVMNTTATLSAWLLVALTAQRAASVVWPHRVNVICTRHKSVVIVVVISAVCSLMYSHTAYGYDMVKLGNGTAETCTFGSRDYQDFYVSVWVRTDMLIYSLLPCAFLIVSNAVLGWKLAVAVKQGRESFSTGREDGIDSRRKKASSATVTIIVVSVAFVVVTIPSMTYNILYYSYASEDTNALRVSHFLFDLFFVFGLSNFAWNFYDVLVRGQLSCIH